MTWAERTIVNVIFFAEFILVALVSAWYLRLMYSWRKLFSREHFDTLILFPWVLLGGSIGVSVFYPVNHWVFRVDPSVPLGLQLVTLFVPLLVFRSAFLLVVFFWKQLHIELKWMELGALLLPVYMRRMFWLAIFSLLFLYGTMMACLLVANVRNDFLEIGNFVVFMPLVNVLTVIGFLKMRSAVMRDFARLAFFSTPPDLLQFVHRIRGITIVTVCAMTLNVLSFVILEAYYQAVGATTARGTQELARLIISSFTDVFPALWIQAVLLQKPSDNFAGTSSLGSWLSKIEGAHEAVYGGRDPVPAKFIPPPPLSQPLPPPPARRTASQRSVRFMELK